MITREELLIMAHGAVDKCMMPQESINALLSRTEYSNLSKLAQQVLILKFMSFTMDGAYQISLESLLEDKGEFPWNFPSTTLGRTNENKI